jgi:DNA-binding NarL/FixJ family response regulator
MADGLAPQPSIDRGDQLAPRRRRFAPPETDAADTRGDPADRPRVVIADSDPLARRVIRDALQDRHRFIVPGEATTGIEAVELCTYYRPDICLMEVGLAGMGGVEATRRIAESAPTVRTLVFSREDGIERQLEVLAAGACGFLSKSAEVEEVVGGIRTVLAGEAVIEPRTAMRLIERLRVLPEAGVGMRPVASGLTQREWEVLDLLSRGCDTHEMAAALVVSEETIYSHVKNVLRKLGVHSRQEAIRAAQSLRGPVAGIAGGAER